MYGKFVAILVCLIAFVVAVPAPNKDSKYVVSEYMPNYYSILGALNECFYGDDKVVECVTGEYFVTEPCEEPTGTSERKNIPCPKCICDYTMEKGFIFTNFDFANVETCSGDNEEWYINKLDTCVEIYDPIYLKYTKTEDDKIKITYHESDETCIDTPTGEEIVEDGACIVEGDYAVQLYLTDKILEESDGTDEPDEPDGSVANLVASGLVIIGTMLIAA